MQNRSIRLATPRRVLAFALLSALSAPAFADGYNCVLQSEQHPGDAAETSFGNAFGDLSVTCGQGAASVGPLSTASGYNAAASGYTANSIGGFSTSVGRGAVAIGGFYDRNNDNSITRTFLKDADGNSVLAENGGNLLVSTETTYAYGNWSTAIGAGSHSIGDMSTVYGADSTAVGLRALALGARSNATALDSTAIGGGTASGVRSLAIGLSTSAGQNSVAIGPGATSSFADSVALGSGSVTDRAGTVSVGKDTAMRQITHMAAGTEATDAVNLGQLNAGIATANAYTNTAVATGGTQANSYTDNREAAIRADAASANSAIRTEMTTGDTATLTAANTYTDTKINALGAMGSSLDAYKGEVNDRFEHTDKRIDRIGAMGSAMLNMAINAAGGTTEKGRIAVGAGIQGGSTALSVGYGKRIGDRASVSFGGSFSGSESSAGVGFGLDL